MWTALADPTFLGEVGSASKRYRDDADEVAAEAVARLCQMAKSRRYSAAAGRPIGLAMGVLPLVAREVARTKRRWRQGMRDEDLECSAIGVSPCDRLITEEAIAGLRRALSSLEEADRSMIERRYAMAQSDSPADPWTSTERSRLRRAILRLRERISQGR